MSFSNTYHKIIKYLVTATCTEPLHIGGNSGEPEEVLIHPVDELPFIQASGIAGVFRSYYQAAFGEESANELFGYNHFDSNMNAAQMGSKVKFGDGTFSADRHSMKLELRPRVSIDAATGTCAESIVKGTNRKAGHKFNMAYIGAGASFTFPIYLFASEFQDDLEDVFAAVNNQILQFGGQKSNGCGYMKIEKLLSREFDMRNEKDRKLWFGEEDLEETMYSDRTDSLNKESVLKKAYEILVEGHTEGQLLVKSIAVSECGKDAPDSMNIQNSAGDYIVPGSSFKGAVRSQMEKILMYLEKSGIDTKDIITNSFGKTGTKEQEGKLGNLCFFDTVIGNKEDNDLMPLSHRIHIDKFTGGVMQGSLFTEKNIAGKLAFEIDIRNKNRPDSTCGVLLMALRDLAVGAFSVGGGYNVGKGIISVEKIQVVAQPEGNTAILDFKNRRTEDESGVIRRCMSAVYGGTEECHM